MYFTPSDREFSHTSADKQITNCWTALSGQGDRIFHRSMNLNSVCQAPASWVHTVPTYMPWASKPSQVMQPGVMRFTASSVLDPCTSQTATSWELLHNLGQTGGPTGIHPHLKRRSESPENMKPTKKFISVERMGARFNQMHISNEYRTQQSPGSNGESSAKKDSQQHRPIRTLEELEEMLANEISDESDVEEDKQAGNKGGIILSPELKKLMEERTASFSSAMIEEMKKPSMALVLWQPPGETIKEKIKAAISSSSKTDNASSAENEKELHLNSSENNNNTLVDLNVLHSNERHPSVFSFSTPSSNSFAELDTMEDDLVQQFDLMDDEMEDL